MNGPDGDALDWGSIDWAEVEGDVGRLRQRIFTASQAGDLAKIGSDSVQAYTDPVAQVAHAATATGQADIPAVLHVTRAGYPAGGTPLTTARSSLHTAPRSDGRHIDLRRTLRRSQRTGGDPARLARSRHTVQPRPLVLLCDISGSMEPYTRAYLHFFHAAASGVKAEAFVFATRLTRLTTLLRACSPEAALQKAGTTAPDWSGGTRIGQSLAEFNNRYGRRGMARGAVVVIFSDGWERDDPTAVGREMARLSRLAHRVIWVNPRKAAPGYSPQAAGMVAALPYCDSFVCGHNVAALTEVIAAIACRDDVEVQTT